MSESNPSATVREELSPGSVHRGALLDRAMHRAFRRMLDGFRHGELTLTWPGGRVSRHGHAEAGEPKVSMTLHNYRPLRRTLLRGDVGFAESYIHGDWSADSLVRLFELFLRNEHSHGISTGGAWWSRGINGLRHALNRNSPAGSRRNIAFHYDLGNDFYRLWLDPTMSYSSALFDAANTTLEAAQRNKMARVRELLEARRGARVLEIGCGWGSLAGTLARDAGCRVTGISLSREQLAWAERRQGVTSDARGPGGASPGDTDFRFVDYRDVDGRFDHIVSIEMFEAVGMRYWQTYFEKLAALLESGGSAVLQVITILESRFEPYRRSPDFIQQYIFPGGMLPTKTRLAELAREAGLRLDHSEWFGESYARTLAQWYERFERSRREVLAQGFDQRFMRTWEYYLAYCESGFRSGATDVGLLRLVKP